MKTMMPKLRPFMYVHRPSEILDPLSEKLFNFAFLYALLTLVDCIPDYWRLSECL